MKLNKFTIIIIILLLLVGGYFYWNNSPQLSQTLKASGTIETTEIKVGSQVGGRVDAVKAEEGQTTKVNDVLVILDGYQLPAEKQSIESQLAQAQAQLQRLQNGFLPAEIAQAQGQYNEALAGYQLAQNGARSEEKQQATAQRRQSEASYKLANDNYFRFKQLLEKQVVSRQEFETVETQYKTAQEQFNSAKEQEKLVLSGSRQEEINAAKGRLLQAQSQLSLMRQGPRREDIAAQQAVVKSLEARVSQINKSLDEVLIKAPCPCEISSLNIKAGQLILPGQSVATLINPNDLWVRVYIPEEYFGRVKLGDEVTLTVDAFNKTTFKGKVSQLGSRAEFTPRNVQTEKSRRMQVFGVKIKLDNTDKKLRPGMIADVKLKLN